MNTAQYWIPTVLHTWAAWVRRQKHISKCDIWDDVHLGNAFATDEQMIVVDRAVYELPAEFRDVIKQRYLEHKCIDDFSETMQAAIDLLSSKIKHSFLE